MVAEAVPQHVGVGVPQIEDFLQQPVYLRGRHNRKSTSCRADDVGQLSYTSS